MIAGETGGNVGVQRADHRHILVENWQKTFTEEKPLFTEELQKWLKGKADQSCMADDAYALTTTGAVSADDSRVMEIWRLEFDTCEDED